MPVNMAVHKPWAKVVCSEMDCDVVVWTRADADHVSPYRILVLIIRAARDVYDIKVVAV